jgi:hypothetical protein
MGGLGWMADGEVSAKKRMMEGERRSVGLVDLSTTSPRQQSKQTAPNMRRERVRGQGRRDRKQRKKKMETWDGRVRRLVGRGG